MGTLQTYFPVVAKRAIKSKEKCSQLIPKDTGVGSSSRRIPQEISSSAIKNELLKTLSDPTNPITHSDIYERTDHIVSFSNGHQVSGGRHPKVKHAHDEKRDVKLKEQQEDLRSHASTSNGKVLNGTRIYINGYLENTTDIEMKRLVLEAGGEIVRTALHCTHILTSRGLSGSKTHKILTKKTRTNVHVVKPEWVFDSISVGKKRPERSYAIVKQANTLESFFEACR